MTPRQKDWLIDNVAVPLMIFAAAMLIWLFVLATREVGWLRWVVAAAGGVGVFAVNNRRLKRFDADKPITTAPGRSLSDGQPKVQRSQSSSSMEEPKSQGNNRS